MLLVVRQEREHAGNELGSTVEQLRLAEDFSAPANVVRSTTYTSATDF
jgi:hypothetical protein